MKPKKENDNYRFNEISKVYENLKKEKNEKKQEKKGKKSGK